MLRPLRSALALVLLAGCSSHAATKPTTTTTVLTTTTPSTVNPGACLPTPEKHKLPSWIPADLPLPAGTFASQELSGLPTAQVVLGVPGNLVDWVKFVNAQWAASGWAQGRGEAEQGEVENSYVRRDTTGQRPAGGAWRARDPYCDRNLIEVLLIYRQ